MAIMFLTGPDICAIRHNAGMNQREFGDLLGVADATVNRWERGHRRPKYEMMERLNELAKKYSKPRKETAVAK